MLPEFLLCSVVSTTVVQCRQNIRPISALRSAAARYSSVMPSLAVMRRTLSSAGAVMPTTAYSGIEPLSKEADGVNGGTLSP